MSPCIRIQTRVKTRCDATEYFYIEVGLHQGELVTIHHSNGTYWRDKLAHIHYSDSYAQMTLLYVQSQV